MTAACVAAAALLLAGCGGGPAPSRSAGADAATTSGTGTTPPDREHPVGLIALGHSGMTGFQSDPDRPGENVGANSWAAGSNREVASLYQRMAAALPETEGHVSNVSVNGERADGLAQQVTAALAVVPVPRLAVVQILDNDIACDGTDSAHLPEFRAQVRAAVQEVVKASPKATVVLVSSPGRPATYAAQIATLPQTPVDLVGSGPCDLFTRDRVVNPAGIARTTALVKAYEAELARACEGIPQCHTDGGAAGRIVDQVSDLGVDLGHLSVRGHARMAAAVWPVVADLLDVP